MLGVCAMAWQDYLAHVFLETPAPLGYTPSGIDSQMR
jgi:hypothetical protein